MSDYSPSVVLIGQVALLVLEELNRDASQRFSSKHIKEILSKKMQSGKIQFEDEAYALDKIESTGQVRWFAFIHFAVSFLKHVGYKTGPRGFWEITKEGQEFLDRSQDRKSIEEEIYQLVREYHYHQYASHQRGKPKVNATELAGTEVENDSEIDENIETEFVVSSFDEDDARSSIYRYLEKMTPTNFQKLVGFLFEGMGYEVPPYPSKGRDGGIDIVAHKDPIGLVGSGIVKIQVKHTSNIEKNSIGMPKITELRGLCTKEHSIPVFVSLGGFTRDVYINVGTDSGDFVSLIDCVRFVELWIEHLDKIPEEGKRLFPLKKVYLIDS